MIIPDHWAEAHSRHQAKGKSITVRRFGWSNDCAADAQAMAQARADEALQRIRAGEALYRREPKVAYNGAEGVPIREEVLSRHGDTVISRNSYGAHCLNTPHVLFADIDLDTRPPPWLSRGCFVVLLSLGALAGWLMHSLWIALGGLVVSLLSGYAMAQGIHSALLAWQGGADSAARRRLKSYLAARPAWAVRVYRTPAGLRVLATHQPFSATHPEVSDFFKAVGVDPQYARMCLRQHCFRARLTAKPWRIGVAHHMRPRPGVWPVKPEHMPARQAWIAQYEAKASAFSSCQFVESLGSGVEHIDVRPVIELHDRESRALHPNAPIA